MLALFGEVLCEGEVRVEMATMQLLGRKKWSHRRVFTGERSSRSPAEVLVTPRAWDDLERQLDQAQDDKGVAGQALGSVGS
jgi:hypothetical protein